MSNLPMLFMRSQPCDKNSDVVPNSQINGPHRVSYIVALPTSMDFTYLNTAWQDNPVFPDGEICTPSIDTLHERDIYIFDGDSPEENFELAKRKMAELWLQVPLAVR